MKRRWLENLTHTGRAYYISPIFLLSEFFLGLGVSKTEENGINKRKEAVENHDRSSVYVRKKKERSTYHSRLHGELSRNCPNHFAISADITVCL